MRKISTLALAGALCLATALQPVLAAGFFTNGVPPAGGSQYPLTLPLTGNESVPADTNLPSGLNPASESVTVTQLNGAGSASYGLVGNRNLLVGGDFGTNQWQRGTTASANITNTLTYYADGWWNLGGASSSINVTKETGASDITTAFAASARFQRTSTNTDVAAICTGQVLTSAQSTQLQSKTVEFVTHLLAGANFSAASSNVTMTIGYGTGSDQSAASFAAGTWTGYVAAVAQLTPITGTWARYSAVAAIPVTATQVGVKICYTPVGTAGANDWFEFTGAQLDANPAAVALTGVAGTAGNAASFDRKPLTVETDLEDYYYQQINETNGVYLAAGMVSATNVEKATLQLFGMRATPTCTFTAGGFDWNIAGTNGAVGTLTQVSGSTANTLVIGDTKTGTAGGVAFLNGTNTTGAIKCSAEL